MIDRADLIRYMQDAYEAGDVTARDSFKRLCMEAAELLGEVERLEALEPEVDRLRGLLLRAWRLLATDEPQNRHPYCVNKHREAVAFAAELRPEVTGR